MHESKINKMVCVVDFDGTLYRNDFFLEVFFKTLIERPFYLFKLFCIKKLKLVEVKKTLLNNYHVNYDTKFLMNELVINWLELHKNNYSKIYLVSASPDFFVKHILENQKFLDGIFGSTEINLKGIAKLNFILNRWGEDFAYLGDSIDDAPIFEKAKEAYKVTINKIINVKSISQTN